MAYPGSTNARFQQTKWAVVLGGSEAALEELCRIYWPPLYGFLRRSGHSPHDAQDLVQGFLASLFENEGLKKVDPEKGRFRNFLLAGLKYFAFNEWDKSQTAKRGGRSIIISLEEFTLSFPENANLSTNTNPELEYDRDWACTLLGRTHKRLKALRGRGSKSKLFDALSPYLSGEVPNSTFSVIAKSFAMKETTLRSAVHALRKEFGEIVDEEIAQTLASPTVREIQSERRHLFRIFATAA